VDAGPCVFGSGQVRLIEDDAEAVLAVSGRVEPEAGHNVPGVQRFEIRRQASVKRRGGGGKAGLARKLRAGSSQSPSRHPPHI